MWNLKRNDTNEFTYETERDSQTINLWFLGVVGGEIVREFGKVMHTLLYLKHITSKVLLYSTRNSAQWYVATWPQGSLGENGYMYMCG